MKSDLSSCLAGIVLLLPALPAATAVADVTGVTTNARNTTGQTANDFHVKLTGPPGATIIKVTGGRINGLQEQQWTAGGEGTTDVTLTMPGGGTAIAPDGQAGYHIYFSPGVFSYTYQYWFTDAGNRIGPIFNVDPSGKLTLIQPQAGGGADVRLRVENHGPTAVTLDTLQFGTVPSTYLDQIGDPGSVGAGSLLSQSNVVVPANGGAVEYDLTVADAGLYYGMYLRTGDTYILEQYLIPEPTAAALAALCVLTMSLRRGRA